MTPKQQRIKNVLKTNRNSKIKRYAIGILVIAGFLKLLSLGLVWLGKL